MCEVSQMRSMFLTLKLIKCSVFFCQWTRTHPDVQRFAAVTGGQNWIQEQELHHQMLRNKTDSSGRLTIIGLIFPHWSIQSNLRQWNSDLCWNQRKCCCLCCCSLPLCLWLLVEVQTSQTIRTICWYLILAFISHFSFFLLCNTVYQMFTSVLFWFSICPSVIFWFPEK